MWGEFLIGGKIIIFWGNIINFWGKDYYLYDNDHDDDNDDDKDKGCGNELHEYDEDDSSLRLYKKTRGLNEKGERGDMIRGP